MANMWFFCSKSMRGNNEECFHEFRHYLVIRICRKHKKLIWKLLVLCHRCSPLCTECRKCKWYYLAPHRSHSQIEHGRRIPCVVFPSQICSILQVLNSDDSLFQSCSSSTRTLIIPVKSVIKKAMVGSNSTCSPDETIMSVTHGKFTALDISSFSQDDYDVSLNNNIRLATSEYFSLHNRLPELSKDDVLVKPLPADNNWILLPSAVDERWRSSKNLDVVVISTPQAKEEGSPLWRRGLTSLLRFIGPKS